MSMLISSLLAIDDSQAF